MRWWDIEPVLRLERELFPDDAWSKGMFWSELAHARGPGASRRYVVAVEPAADGPERLVGYAGLAAAGAGTGDVTGDVQTIAVAADHWGTGLGASLLTDLLQYATAFECTELLLEVRVDNTRAQKLYLRFGFEPIGFRRGYYQPGNVDALVMRLADPASGVPGPEAGPPDVPVAEVPVAESGTPDAQASDPYAPDAPATELPGTEQGPDTHG
ncbi:GNAT family N-acetyltransferase [Streptomyces sp. YIM 130001]|uniref:GNAT family N-acetyltransferase n=1 Tax=Streptomyces sp. YIM 130001 TaxID=2259644 RepID=UPI000E65C4DB|nr:GNAT family N-acetyltransferase [Streptomyces sp. YIM 130001]